MEQVPPEVKAETGNPEESPGVGGLVLLTIALLLGVSAVYSFARRSEIMANWASHRMDPLMLFMAPFFKPEEDPRSRFQFASDNFTEVVKIYMDKMIAVALTPVFQIFGTLTSSIATSANGLTAIRSLLGKMFTSFQSMVDIFTRRFGNIGQALTSTFRQLMQSLERTWAVAVSSIYAGLSAIHAMKNVVQLMVTIVITILIILAVLIFFFFFALWPLLPLIILGGVMVGEAAPLLGMGNDAAGASSSLACFDIHTRIALPEGGDRALQDVKPGTVLHGDSVVEGVLRFEDTEKPCDMYNLDGVLVTGSHIVYEGDTPLFVAEHPDATDHGTRSTVICLLTSNRRIPVVSNKGIRLFADWEELDNEDDGALEAWHTHVFSVLNGPSEEKPTHRSKEEAGFSGLVQIWGEDGTFIPISDIVPGMHIVDANGCPTRVTGVVELRRSACDAICIGRGWATTGCWIFKEGCWNQTVKQNVLLEPWYHLFTESGTFVAEGWKVRDFSDVGNAELPKTYKSTLEALTRKPSQENRHP